MEKRCHWSHYNRDPDPLAAGIPNNKRTHPLRNCAKRCVPYGVCRAANCSTERYPHNNRDWCRVGGGANAPLTHLRRHRRVVTRTLTGRQNGRRDDADTPHGHSEREPPRWSPARLSPPSAVGRCSSPPPAPITVPKRVRCTRTETSFGGTAPVLPAAVNTAALDNRGQLQTSLPTTPQRIRKW